MICGWPHHEELNDELGVTMATAKAQLNPGLLDLLGRVWQLDQPVAGLAIAAGAVTFALADGSVAQAPLADPEPPEQRLRVSAEDGRSTIRPRRHQPPPLSRHSLDPGAPVRLVAAPGRGCLLGDAGGRLHHLAKGGTPELLAELPDGPINALAYAADRALLAVASGHQVRLLDPAGREQASLTTEQPTRCLAFAPGGRLAIGAADRLRLWSPMGGDPIIELALDGEPLTLAWSDDGALLACGLARDGLCIWCAADGGVRRIRGYPAPLGCVAWSAGTDALATAGAFRLIVWPTAELAQAEPRQTLATGRPGLVLIEQVAAAPNRRLIAAGYEDGLLILAEPGQRDELLVAPAGQGAITALAWSADGSHLAYGTAAGRAAILALPNRMFK